MKNNRLVLGEIGFTHEITTYKEEKSDSYLYYPNEYFDECPKIDLSFDVWSLGCVFYEICIGKPAFTKKEEIIENQLPPLNHKMFDHGITVMIQEMLKFKSKYRPLSRYLLKFLVSFSITFFKIICLRIYYSLKIYLKDESK